MREISIHDIKPKEDLKIQEALDKLSEGLAMLAKMNMDTSQILMKALKEMPEPKIQVVVPEPEKVNYVFNIERDAAGRMTKVKAFAQ